MPTLPLRLGALEILGLRDPAEGGWARLRALQYAKLPELALRRALSQALAAVITIGILSKALPLSGLIAWSIAFAVTLRGAWRTDRSFGNVAGRSLGRQELAGQARSYAACALAWGVALVLLDAYGSDRDHFAVWTLVAMLIAAMVATTPAAPLGTSLFALITGSVAVLEFLWQGDIAFAAATAAFVSIAVAGTIEASRTYLSARIAEAGGTEKDEVVSLLLREFEENQADWLWQVDTNRRVRSASPRFAFALGRDPSAIEGQSFVQMVAGEAWSTGNVPPSLHDLTERLRRRESFSNLLVRVEVGAGRRWWELSGTPMRDEKGIFVGFRGVGSDVTEQRESDEKIAYLARYDPLTGLPNRLMLTEALGEAMRYAEQWRSRCALLMIDLDRFKQVNDSLGHQVGDRLLAQVSQRLKTVLSDNERCGRLGGDEFAVVMRDAAERGRIERLAEALIEALSDPYCVDNHTLYVGASIGSAIGPRDGTTVETLMRNADLALYQAKDEGGGEHRCYEPALHANAEEKRKLESSLRQAMDKNELRLNFQPVVDATTEQVVSFEALMRWHSSEHGAVSPGKFIPLAEDTRLIVPIGEWALHEACRQAVLWPSPLKVAVNVSGEQLLEPDFAQTVVRALAESRLPAHRLEVEVTESIFLRDARMARQTLEEIMALGCSVALDDFGTGYSSLGYLRSLRFSTTKVDRSFVQGAALGHAESLAIIRAVVAMAQSLDMSTTAEGVETAEEAAMIRRMGCDKIQGFYFGRPMEAAEALALVGRKGLTAAA
ncbi:MAG: EAL domain-containing protein [Croceibacterium sp.]